MSDNVTKLVKLNKRASQALDVLKGLERGVSPAEWQAAMDAGKAFVGKDGVPLKADALRKAFKRATGSLLAADVIDIENDMVTIRSGPGGEELSFGTAEEDFADEDE